jgi:hypothetical protein
VLSVDRFETISLTSEKCAKVIQKKAVTHNATSYPNNFGETHFVTKQVTEITRQSGCINYILLLGSPWNPMDPGQKLCTTYGIGCHEGRPWSHSYLQVVTEGTWGFISGPSYCSLPSPTSMSRLVTRQLKALVGWGTSSESSQWQLHNFSLTFVISTTLPSSPFPSLFLKPTLFCLSLSFFSSP